MVQFASSRDFWHSSGSNVLECRSLLAHTFSSQHFGSDYLFPHKSLHTVNPWAPNPAMGLLCSFLLYFCSSLKWQKRKRSLFGIWVVIFCLLFLGSFTFERIFFLLSSYWYGLQKFTYPLKLSFQFIVLLYLDFSFQICMQSKHDAHVFFKNSSFLIYCNRFLQLKLHKWLIFDVTYNVVVITIYCLNENSLELSN